MSIQIPPILGDAPTPPDRADRATFAARATALADYIKNVLVSGINVIAANVNNNATEAFQSASDAELARDAARAARDATVAAANYRGDYAPDVTYLVGQSVSYFGLRYAAKKTNLGITPVDGPDWLLIPASEPFSNTTALAQAHAINLSLQ